MVKMVSAASEMLKCLGCWTLMCAFADHDTGFMVIRGAVVEI